MVGGRNLRLTEGTTRMMNLPTLPSTNKYAINRGLLFAMSLCVASVMLLCSVGMVGSV